MFLSSNYLSQVEREREREKIGEEKKAKPNRIK
jgi:hypothetical protein